MTASIPSEYLVNLTDDNGNIVDSLQDFITLDLSRKVNEITSMELVLPDTVNFEDLVPDNRIEISRSVDGGVFEFLTDTVWVIRSRSKRLFGSERTFAVECVPAIELLQRRIVDFATGTSQSSKTKNADSMMVEIVSENFGATATGTGRDISSVFVTISAANTAPQISKDFAWRNVLSVLREISETSSRLGTDLFYDVTYNKVLKVMEFRTYLGQRGTDRGSSSGTNKLTLSGELNTLTNINLEYDYFDEINYVRALGQGEESNRLTSTNQDNTRINFSTYNRREFARDIRNVSDTTILSNEAESRVYDGRPRVRFEAIIQDTLATKFQRDWDFGDKVVASFDDISFDAWINSLRINIAAGRETVSGRLRSIIDL